MCCFKSFITSGCPWPSDTVKSRASTPPPPPPPGFCFTIWFPQQHQREKTRDRTSCLKTWESRNRKKEILILISSNQDLSSLLSSSSSSSLACSSATLLLQAMLPPCWEPENGRARSTVQGTRELVGLLWRTWPGTPHSGPGRWKSGSPGVPGRAWSAFYDGPKLRHKQTKELIYKIREQICKS